VPDAADVADQDVAVVAADAECCCCSVPKPTCVATSDAANMPSALLVLPPIGVLFHWSMRHPAAVQQTAPADLPPLLQPPVSPDLLLLLLFALAVHSCLYALHQPH
jgi:hypothetical protein